MKNTIQAKVVCFFFLKGGGWREREDNADNGKEKVVQPDLSLNPDTMQFWCCNSPPCRDATEVAVLLFGVVDLFRSHCTLHVTNQVLCHLRILLGIFLICCCPLAVPNSLLPFQLVCFVAFCGPLSFFPPFWLGLDPFLHAVFAWGFRWKFCNLSNSLGLDF